MAEKKSEVLELVIDHEKIKEWTLGDVEDFRDAAVSANFAVLREILAQIVVSWNLEGDCHDPQAYRALKVTVWRVIQEEVMNQLGKIFREQA